MVLSQKIAACSDASWVCDDARPGADGVRREDQACPDGGDEPAGRRLLSEIEARVTVMAR